MASLGVPPPLGALLPPLVEPDEHVENPEADSDQELEQYYLLPDQLPDVKGMTDNVFFFTHKHSYTKEMRASNKLESTMAVELYQYLLHQGYQSSDLLIITANEFQEKQLYELSNHFPSHPNVRLISTTENPTQRAKIVILTTLATQPLEVFVERTEFALRTASIFAAHGLFIFGNIEELCARSSLWQSVAASLEVTASLGGHLTLQCENHPQQNEIIGGVSDWALVAAGGCSLQCARGLPCGHQCVRTCHSERTKCAPCRRQTLKTLPCGHRKTSACDRPAADCSVTISVTLPACGHTVVRTCSQRVPDCSAPCLRTLPCGHRCQRTCHVKDDPQHLTYTCREPCTRRRAGCTAASADGGHACPLPCHAVCPPCTALVLKARPHCAHSARVPCNAPADSAPCDRPCKRVLDCKHHFCFKKCFEECGPCVRKVTLTSCGHEVSMPCVSSGPLVCRAPCKRALPCGHPCPRACGDECVTQCQQRVMVQLEAQCGHRVQPPCHVYNEPSFEVSVLVQYCTVRCDTLLACGHRCKGTCAECCQGRVHRACNEPCGEAKVCQHVCMEPCSAACPPCPAPCGLRCDHAACPMVCGAPCNIDCQKPSTLCRHQSSVPCSTWRPCPAPCPCRLACGHRCRGLCGVRCPDVCRICRPEEFPKDTIMMDEYDDDVRFVVLEDCGHMESVEHMDRLVEAATSEALVRVPACHMCRTPILNTPRYRPVLTRIWPAVQGVKLQIYGTADQINDRKIQLMQSQLQVSNVFQQGNTITANANWTDALHQVKMQSQKKHISLPKLQMLLQSYTILLTIAENYAEFYKHMQSKLELRHEVTELIVMLCRVLVDNMERLNEQIQRDVGNELKRMNVMVQLSKILNHSAYEAMKSTSNVVAATLEARQAILTRTRYDPTVGEAALQRLQQMVKITMTKEERDLIVRAIGAKKGSWYRCPNGHVYNIGQCGRPHQVSTCPDCGANVGGLNYNLQPGNSQAYDLG